MTKTQSRYFLAIMAILVMAGLILTACASSGAEEPAPVAEEESGWNTPAEFAEGTFPPTLSKIDEHKNPWQIKDCFTCHDKETGGAPAIAHEDPYTQSCRQCHVPTDGVGIEY